MNHFYCWLEFEINQCPVDKIFAHLDKSGFSLIQVLMNGTYSLGQILSFTLITNEGLTYKDSKSLLQAFYEQVNSWIEETPWMAEIKYKDYLGTRAWHIKREIIWGLRVRCALCGCDFSFYDTYHIHHNTYTRLPLEEIEDLTLLCESCHTNFHHGNLDDERITKYFRHLSAELEMLKSDEL